MSKKLQKSNRPSEIPTSVPTIDSEPVEVVSAPKPKNTPGQVHPANDSYGNIPLEDKAGQGLWVRTRMCFCRDDAVTDCRFHGYDEPDWRVCPATIAAKKDKKMLGRWLWAHNNSYGKATTTVLHPEEVSHLLKAPA